MASQRKKPAEDPQLSTYADGYWLCADRRPNAAELYPEPTDHCGKWLVFVPVAEVDGWWASIKRAVWEGRLGHRAKVATAKPNPHARDSRERVICVYT